MYESYWLRTTQMERKSTKTISDTEKQLKRRQTNMVKTFSLIELNPGDWWRALLLYNWTPSPRRRKDDSNKLVSIIGCCLLWYVTLSMEYVVITFMVDDLLGDYSATKRYYLRVFCTFVFLQVIVNWLCTVWYESDLRETRDNPEVLMVEDTTRNGQQCEINFEDCHSDSTGLTWSWCDLCKMKQPPRTHHCKICQKCILKRDHHCFFTATCIGFYNQRYFVVLLFYLTVASFGYFPFLHRYMQINYAPSSSWIDYFLPIVMYDWFFAGLDFKYVILVSHYYTVWWGGLMSFWIFCIQIYSITKGLTSNEIYKRRTIRSTATVSGNFRDVFGAFWLLNFLFPTVILFRQESDGKHWAYVKNM